MRRVFPQATESVAIATQHASQRTERRQGGAIQLRDVVKRYGTEGAAAVDTVTLDVAPGEFIVLLGTSGSGKTTLLKMVNRLIEPTSGTITIDGTDALSLPAPELRRTIGYVIQQTGLFPHMRVKDNVAVVPRLLKWDKQRIEARVSELLDLVGLPSASYAPRYPSQLSGGEQQRVGLARALAAEPSTMLMDEPFGALDAITRTRLQGELKRIHRQLRHTILFVTHDVDEAFALADRIVIMSHGRIEQLGTPLEIISNPTSEFVAKLVDSEDPMRRMNLLPLTAAVIPGQVDTTTEIDQPLGPDSSLRDGLAALMSRNRGALPVVDLDGLVIGSVTLESVRAAVSGATVPEVSSTRVAG